MKPGLKNTLVAVAVCLAVLLAGEVYLRLTPPPGLKSFQPPKDLTGPYKPDPELGLAYRDFKDFTAEFKQRLDPFLPLVNPNSQKPIWAFFGSSFFIGHHGLADYLAARVKDRRVFHLRKIIRLSLRFAQVKILLENGFKPERIFMGLTQVDTHWIGPSPLKYYRVTAQGGFYLAARRPPGPLAWLSRNSRLAEAAWLKTDLAKGNPFFNFEDIFERVDETILADLKALLTNLARLSRRYRVPVTVIVLPHHEQILDRRGWVLQDVLAPELEKLGLDYVMIGPSLKAHPRPISFYLPDRHLKDEGNGLVMKELLDHLAAKGYYRRPDR